jgi:OmpA-OmpF porin, OOP family
MYKIIVSSILVFTLSKLSAQDDNLIPNGSFETTKKIKEKGQIELATGWSSPTEAKADLFTKGNKVPDWGIPDNLYGGEMTEEGDSYAGIVMYSEKNKTPLSYLQAELSAPLEAGKTYCVGFEFSLSDLSKYGCNNIGLYISEKQINQGDIEKYNIKPQVRHSKNRIYEEQYTWEKMCKTFKAKGGEKYVVIGNFANPDSVQTNKLKRPSGFTKPQISNAYYYIENVYVIPVEKTESCSCEKKEKTEKTNIVYSKNVSNEAVITDVQKIEFKKIFFSNLSAELSLQYSAELDELIKLLEANSDIKIQVKSHTDATEQAKDNALCSKRAEVVISYLTGKGINKERITTSLIKDDEPATDEDSVSGRASNRRVEFSVVQ